LLEKMRDGCPRTAVFKIDRFTQSLELPSRVSMTRSASRQEIEQVSALRTRR
jgi:hypothetical protein